MHRCSKNQQERNPQSLTISSNASALLLTSSKKLVQARTRVKQREKDRIGTIYYLNNTSIHNTIERCNKKK